MYELSHVQLVRRIAHKRILLRWLVALAVICAHACSGDSPAPATPPGPITADPPPVAPVAASLALSPVAADLETPGGSVRLTATVRDADGNVLEDAPLTWSSSAPAVATVDGTGLVTAAGAGTTTLTVSTGDLSAAATVTVSEASDPPPPVAPTPASLTVSPATARIEAPDGTLQLSAEVRDSDGNLLTDVIVAWASNAPEVAIVSADGLLSAVAEGTATVTATAGELSATATVTVDPPLAAEDPDARAVAADRAALVALYESAGGERWIDSTNWLSDRPLDEWHGVYTDRDGRIEYIALFSNGLAGPIPPEIGQLTALIELHLGSNELSGSLPPELGKLTNLTDLSLYYNSLSGELPRELGHLARLERLSLIGNALSGAIPPEFGALANLVELSLLRNGLSGPIPGELGNLARLERLDLAGNRLSGPIPPELGNLARLTALALWGNRLTGPIPPELGNLGRLAELYLNDNGLSGTVPRALTALPLTFFWWSGNPGLCIADTAIFAEWVSSIGSYTRGDYCNRSDRAALDTLYRVAGGSGWALSEGWPDAPPDKRHGVGVDASGRVIEIDLAGNGLEGQLPLEIGDLATLKELRLGDNPELSGRLPYTLARLDELSEFDYAGTGLCVPREDFLRGWLDGVAVHEGTGLDCEPTADRDVLATIHETMGGREWFDSGNWLTEAPLREWYGVDADAQGKVIRLDLSHNGLAGAIPPDIVALDKLEELTLVAFDSRGAPIPPELGELPNLRKLTLAGIRAAGSIPPQLGNLARLEVLDLTGNALSGSIPPELGNLPRLIELHLDNNALAGSIPHLLANAARLEQIHLANNGLTGALPASIAGLAELRILDLSGNKLSDYLPTAFGDFARLEYLNLSYNDLFGAIPAELGRLENLAELYLSNNSLSGPVPPELAGLSRLHSLALTGNAELSGPIPADLAGLGELSYLQAAGTALCAPPDAAFLVWLDGLLTRRIRPCGTEPEAAYLTQAIQSRELPIALVSGEPALLRVFPTAERATSARLPTVRADFYLKGTLAHSVDIAAGPGPIPTEIEEGSLDRSANAAIPAEVVQPGLEMVIEIDPQGTLDDSLGVARRIPESGRLAVEVRPMPVFDVTVVPFVWETNPDMSVVELVTAMEADPMGHEMLRHMRTLLPVAEIAVTAHAPVRTSSNEANELTAETRLIATMEGATGYYMGLLSGEFSGAAGIGDLGRRVAYSITDAATIAHEFGHNLSLQHTPCGNPLGVDPAYPYANASPGGWGYDFSGQRLVAPDEHHDLMSYCGPPWISDFSFDKALRYRLHSEGRLRPPPAGEPPAPVSSLIVWGGVDAGAAPFLEPAFVTDAPPALPQAPGRWRIAGSAADGTVLFDLTFAMPVQVHGDGRSSFAFALPAQPGWAGSLESITLSGPGGSFTLEADARPPMTVLRDGPGAQVTGIFREPATADALRGTTRPGLFSRGIPERAGWSR